MPSPNEKSKQLFTRACRVIPGGVNSPVRAWRAVGGVPLFIASGSGARLTDVDGRSYVDFVGSWGPLILGHAHPSVVAAIGEAVARGASFGAPTAAEVELAETIVDAFPSIEKVRLVSSGTEAAMSAIRVARAFTGRTKILKFSGCYHGHADALLVRAGSGATTLGVPDSAGVPEAFTSLTRIAEYNRLEEVEGYVRAEGRDLAAIIVEPVVGNMGVVRPKPGFLEGLRRLATACGALLVFDEVITGFRLSRGGAQQTSGVRADLTCLGKVVGGGLPLGAFGGRSDVMDVLAPLGGAYQAGTLSGNPLAVGAGLATLGELRPERYARLEALGARLEAGVTRLVHDRGIRAAFNRAGSMWTLFFGVDRVESYADARRSDAARYARFFHAMIERGFYLPPSQFEAAFLSLAHSESEIDAFLEAAAGALAGS